MVGQAAEFESIRHLFYDEKIPYAGSVDFKKLPPPAPVGSVGRIPPGCRSVVFCLFPYFVPLSGGAGRDIARYAAGPDYHDICIKKLVRIAGELLKLFPENRFEAFADISPFDEVTGAYLSGLGYKGMNGQIINPEFGSYVFVGEIATDLPIKSSAVPLGSCKNCGMCIKNCPTGALLEDGRVNVPLCRSHITQKKGELTLFEQDEIKKGGLAWGCDICTDICPHNKNPKPSPFPEFYRTVENMEDALADFKAGGRAYFYRGRKTLLRNLEILKRR